MSANDQPVTRLRRGSPASDQARRALAHELLGPEPTLLQLQRSIGNRAVANLMASTHPARITAAMVSRAPDGATATASPKRTVPAEETAMFAALGTMGVGGQHAVQVMGKYAISLSWVTSGAASFDGANKCTINSRLAPGVAAGYFVHEMYHVEQKLTGNSPDADATSVQARTADDATRARLKKAYVDRMVNEEIEGTVRGYEARIGQAGPLMPGEDKYRSTYNYWRKEGKSDSEAKAMGRRRVELMLRPTDGSWPDLAPSQLESYAMYYKRIWDQANRPGAGSP